MTTERVTREEALTRAAAVYARAKIRIDTDRALRAAGIDPATARIVTTTEEPGR